MNIEYIIIGCVVAVALVIAFVRIRYRQEFHVSEGFAGLLYHHGKFLQWLAAGRHICWGRHFEVVAVDQRKMPLTVAGQEVLTADNVALKASLLLVCKVTDPVRAIHETQSWMNDLHTAGQLALRAVLGAVTAEDLLTQRPAFGEQLLGRIKPEAEKIGVQVDAVELKDLMLPADLKRAYADALKARQEGLAALERARGESAALRNLANAARLLEGNPGLLNLRVLQSLAAAQGAGNTLVLGVPGGFVPLKNGAASGPAADQAQPV